MAGTRPPERAPRRVRTRALPVPDALRGCLFCGPAHPDGYRVRFRAEGERVSGVFTPDAAHQGYRGLMSGGLLAALFDCLHYRVALARGVEHAVTARLEVQYRAPIPLGRRVRLDAWLVERRGRAFESRATAALPDGTVAAESTAVYVAIAPERLHAVGARGVARSERP